MVLVISAGLGLLVAGETEFNLAGFVIVMVASALSGLRWTITQVLLQGSQAHGTGALRSLNFEKHNPKRALMCPPDQGLRSSRPRSHDVGLEVCARAWLPLSCTATAQPAHPCLWSITAC